MVKPTIKGVVSKKAVKTVDKATILSSLKTNKTLQDKYLLNTANRWSKKYNFNGDLTFKGISDTGKSVLLAVDGKILKSKYLLSGSKEKPFFLSGRAIAKK